MKGAFSRIKNKVTRKLTALKERLTTLSSRSEFEDWEDEADKLYTDIAKRREANLKKLKLR